MVGLNREESFTKLLLQSKKNEHLVIASINTAS